MVQPRFEWENRPKVGHAFSILWLEDLVVGTSVPFVNYIHHGTVYFKQVIVTVWFETANSVGLPRNESLTIFIWTDLNLK